MLPKGQFPVFIKTSHSSSTPTLTLWVEELKSAAQNVDYCGLKPSRVLQTLSKDESLHTTAPLTLLIIDPADQHSQGHHAPESPP